ncbi:MAG: hypothetical protein V3V09_06270 [Arenicellales bacterium]
MSTPDIIELIGIYNIMGEGLVVEIMDNSKPMLYDRRGLQYRIIERKKLQRDTQVEERALAQINAFSTMPEYSEFSNTRA